MTVPTWWVFVLGSLAAWRLYKLASVDDVLAPLRNRLAPEDSKRREFLECSYCSGWWISTLGTASYYLVTGWSTYGFLLVSFSMSAAVIFLEVLLDLTVAVKDEHED